MTLSEFIEDVLDLQEGLMSRQELEDAQAAYRQWQAGGGRQRRWSASESVKDNRAVAAQFGGKALTGTAKQKPWGERIRAEKLPAMTDYQAMRACSPTGLGRSAKFWINNRERTGQDIGQFFVDQMVLLANAESARSAGDQQVLKRLADQYNALTAAWGFD